MRTLLLIGAGVGDPDQITVAAVKALNRAQVIFVLKKPSDATRELEDLRKEICARHHTGAYRIVEIDDPERNVNATPTYQDAVTDWRSERANRVAHAIQRELDDDGTGAFLIWGDPSLYDSTLGVIASLTGVAFDYEVFPGVTSVQALTAAHRTTLHEVGRPALIMPGRQLRTGVADDADTVAVMLDTQASYERYPDHQIYWGAYLSSPDELLIAGTVNDVKDELARVRAEARTRKGWMFDTYLLKRP